MRKTSTDTQITFRQSRRIMLAFAPVAVLIAAANAFYLQRGLVLYGVAAVFLVVSLIVGLSEETLVLDLRNRSAWFASRFAGFIDRQEAFSFDAIIGCVARKSSVRTERKPGRARYETVYNVELLYRGADGKMAAPIELGTFGDAESAEAEAAAIAAATDRPVISKDRFHELLEAEA